MCLPLTSQQQQEPQAREDQALQMQRTEDPASSSGSPGACFASLMLGFADAGAASSPSSMRAMLLLARELCRGGPCAQLGQLAALTATLLPCRQVLRGRAESVLWSIPEEGDRRLPAGQAEEEEAEEEEDMLEDLIAAAERDIDTGGDYGRSADYGAHPLRGDPVHTLSTAAGRLPSLAGVADPSTLRFRDRRQEARYQRWHALRMAKVDALACLAQAVLHALCSLLQCR